MKQRDLNMAKKQAQQEQVDTPIDSELKNIIEAALSHKIGDATSQAYNRSQLLEKRRVLMLDWQVHLGF